MSARRLAGMSATAAVPGRRTVVVDGVRTPFLRSQTRFTDFLAYDLAVAAVAALLRRQARVRPADIDRLVLGTVIAEPRTSNLAREVGLACGVPQACPAFTVTAACTSANVAISGAVEAIAAGAADIVIAGGAETLSDVPIRWSRPVRKRMLSAQKARGPADYLKLAGGLKLADLAPETPAIAEFSTGLTMGDNAERLAKALGLTRAAQDEWAMASHHRAAKAQADGWLADQIAAVAAPPDWSPVGADNGVRADTSLEKLSTLKPVFDRTFGTVTAGNSSFLTDGAAATLLMSEAAAEARGVTPLARVVSTSMIGLDPIEELLLGPALAVPPALAGAGLALSDIDVWEIHEAFAAPVLAAVQLLDDDGFCRDRAGLAGRLGRIDTARLNAWGGSLSIGHPFGATGARLVTTAARRLHREGGRYAVVTSCAAGALGHALVLERV